MNSLKMQGKMVSRLAGTEFAHFIRVRLMDDEGYNFTDYFGVQIGPCSFLWTNPFAKVD